MHQGENPHDVSGTQRLSSAVEVMAGSWPRHIEGGYLDS
jgi:hypothetical protein